MTNANHGVDSNEIYSNSNDYTNPKLYTKRNLQSATSDRETNTHIDSKSQLLRNKKMNSALSNPLESGQSASNLQHYDINAGVHSLLGNQHRNKKILFSSVVGSSTHKSLKEVNNDKIRLLNNMISA